MTPTKSKNFKLATAFYDYCCAHPELRFWQALRGWCGYPFVLVAKTWSFDGKKEFWEDIKDTFYWDGKDK